MKKYISILLLFFSLYGFSQKDKKAEGTYSICETAIDKDKCLYEQLQQKILYHYDIRAIELITKDTTNDTIAIFSALAVDFDGSVDIANSDISSSDDYIDSIHFKILKSLEPFIVPVDNSGNPLSEMVRTKLYFFLDRKNKNLNPLPYGEDYATKTTGFALIEDVPVFPGCENYPKDKLRKCFNQRMIEHITQHFRYPKKAQRKKISGRVSVVFTIDKKGFITKIRTFGADPILMTEARRIISLLPQMTPGKQKGKLVRVPFAIPITFKLQ